MFRFGKILQRTRINRLQFELRAAEDRSGSKQGGSKQGGSKQGGSKQGGSKQGGSKQGGSVASSHFYHIRSLRERGHRLPTVSVSAATLPFPIAAATLPFPFLQRPYSFRLPSAGCRPRASRTN
ncbi:hypothetical protein MmiAt1_04770 [Methanimicrococcus sp. At1]|uniref:Uncharacterized protein n=1 Tax=Methanimicrococcus hacksteinii TaxID=3028293 RepID=A0ABU3VNE6_9EURY|nr:hypothetical protein [Methanimicrococcus sp. At1]MDV0444928.1 hypothetical protein [Methanimicrococcus sp. At1]